MAILSFLISLAGATMLLLFAVRMVRTGIERRFGASFRRLLTQNDSMFSASMAGLALAVVLQRSAAVALLTSGFSASGMLAFPAGLAIVLGADLGSALIIQVLSFKLDWLVPLLLASGGWLFVKTERKSWRQAGRILMGIALILISLRFLREAMHPIRDSAFLPAIAEYLARDSITAFIAGAALAFVMRSSVAAILMCVTLVQIGAIPVTAGLSLLLGANLGSAFIPLWLTRDMSPQARRVPLANLALRGSWAIIVLLAINLLSLGHLLDIAGPGQSLIYAHILFNLSLLLVLPFCKFLEAPFRAILVDTSGEVEPASLAQTGSVLDVRDIDNPQLAMGNLKRELLRMTELVERMFLPTLELFETKNPTMLKAVRDLDDQVNMALEGIRQYIAVLPTDGMTENEGKTVHSLMEYAIRLESAGDIVRKVLTSLAEEKHKKKVNFSAEGWKEIVRMHEAIEANLRLACNVLISDDLESARLLVIEKTEIQRSERESRKQHLQRLQNGLAQSFETSDIHLETLRALRDFNGHISAVANPILHRNGQLLESRLIMSVDKEAAKQI